MPSKNIDLFISYSRKDARFVDTLEEQLQRKGYSTWVDRQRIEGGQQWEAVLQDALQRARCVILVLSPDAVNSRYVRLEYQLALQQRKPLIPILYRSTTVPQELSALQYSPFQQSSKQNLQKLVEAILRVPIAPTGKKRRPISLYSIGLMAFLLGFGLCYSGIGLQRFHNAATKSVGTIVEYPLPVANSQPYGLTLGPDHQLWFTENQHRRIGYIDATDRLHEVITLPDAGATVIQTGLSHNLWFTQPNQDRVGTIEFPTVTLGGFLTRDPGSAPAALVLSHSGNIQWILQRATISKFYFIPLNPRIFEATLSFGAEYITSDGSEGIWALETVPGTTTLFVKQLIHDSPTTPSLAQLDVNSISAIIPDSQGTLWYLDPIAGLVGTVNANGHITSRIAIPHGAPVSQPEALTADLHNGVWFYEAETNTLIHALRSGQLQSYTIPSPNAEVKSMAFDLAGNLWFTENAANHIGKLILNPQQSGTLRPPPATIPPVASAKTPTTTPIPPLLLQANLGTLQGQMQLEQFCKGTFITGEILKLDLTLSADQMTSAVSANADYLSKDYYYFPTTFVAENAAAGCQLYITRSGGTKSLVFDTQHNTITGDVEAIGGVASHIGVDDLFVSPVNAP